MIMLNMRGLRLRETDREFSSRAALGLLQQRQRLIGNDRPLRIRAQDPVGDVSFLMNQRQPLDLNITLAGEIPEAQFQRTSKDAVVFAIPGTREIIEFVTHPDLPFWVAKNVIAGSLRFGEKVAADIEQASAGSGLRIPTMSELGKVNELLAHELDGLDHAIWTSTPYGDQERGESFIILRHGLQGYSANFPTLDGIDNAVRFVKDK